MNDLQELVRSYFRGVDDQDIDMILWHPHPGLRIFGRNSRGSIVRA